MSSSQGLFSSPLASSQAQNPPLIRQPDGATFALYPVQPAARTDHMTGITSIPPGTHVIALPPPPYTPSTSLAVGNDLPTIQPLPEAIRNAPRPNPRRRQAVEPPAQPTALSANQYLPQPFTLYPGTGEAERQIVNQRITL